MTLNIKIESDTKANISVGTGGVGGGFSIGSGKTDFIKAISIPGSFTSTISQTIINSIFNASKEKK